MPVKKKQQRKKVASKPRRAARRTANVPEKASLSETRTYTVTNPGVPTTNGIANVLYGLLNTSLDQFPRATSVAKGYQHYRIRKIQLRLKSTLDTFAMTGNGYSKPYLYYMIDKAGAIPSNITLEGLKQMGAKPHVLDEREKKITWAPSVLNDAMTAPGGAGSQPSSYRISPWLNTNATSVAPGWNPSTVDHLGVYWYVQAIAYGTPAVPYLEYQMEVEVQFEFKGPLVMLATSTVSAITPQPATINDSPDGVVGGGDDHLASPSF